MAHRVEREGKILPRNAVQIRARTLVSQLRFLETTQASLNLLTLVLSFLHAIFTSWMLEIMDLGQI
jgi:hypothetical protein